MSSYISLHMLVKATTVRGMAAGFFVFLLMASNWVAFQTNLLDLGSTVEDPWVSS